MPSGSSDGSTTLPQPGDVLAAAERIEGRVLHTRTRRATNLSDVLGLGAGGEIWLKYEIEQASGSFKERGALNALMVLRDGGFDGTVITASAGNHAQGVARHASALGLRSIIVMPRMTPKVKIAATQRYGGEVVLHGDGFDEASAFAQQRAQAEGFAFVHPFDDAHVIAGQGTAFLEFFQDAPALDHVFVPVGGGGLIGGALLAREALGLTTQIHAVEPEAIASLRAGLAGDPPPEPRFATIAEGISVKHIGAMPLQLARHYGMRSDDVVAASEDSIETAMVSMFSDERAVVEGAAAASLAGAAIMADALRGQKIGVILCGGNVDPRLYSQVLARDLSRSGRRTRIRIVCSDAPGQLNVITSVIAQHRANVLDITHDRVALRVPAKFAVVDLIVETDDADHTSEVLAALGETDKNGNNIHGFIAVTPYRKDPEPQPLYDVPPERTQTHA
jgi:threonine dehydratase